MSRHPQILSTANLADFKDVDALKAASREELEQWYLFQSQCLFALIGRFGRDGHTVIVDAYDVPIGSQKMYVMPLSPHACALTLREVPSDTATGASSDHTSSGPGASPESGSSEATPEGTT